MKVFTIFKIVSAIIWIASIILLANVVNAWSSNVFTNSLSNENLTFPYQVSNTINPSSYSFSGVGIVNKNSSRAAQKIAACGIISKVSMPLTGWNTPLGNINLSVRKVSDNSIISTKLWGAASTLVLSTSYSDATNVEVIFDNPMYSCEDVYVSVDRDSNDGSVVIFYNEDINCGNYGVYFYNETGWFSKNYNSYCHIGTMLSYKTNIRYLSVPSSVSVLTKGYLNFSGFPIDNRYSFYQENANETSVVIDGNYGRVYLNYTKPNNALTNKTKWQIRISSTIQNISLENNGCWEHLSDKIMLRLSSLEIGADSYTYADCLSNAGWQQVATSSGSMIGITASYSTPFSSRVYDGNWDTDAGYCYNDGHWFHLINGDANNTVLFEEAIIWDIQSIVNPSLTVGNSQIWNYSGTFNQTNNRTVNFATYINNYLSTCSYISGYCLVPFLFHSDTKGILGYSDMSFDNTGITENGQTYNPTTYEYAIEPFTLNISYDSSYWQYIVGTLVYNGTSYTSTRTGTPTNAIFSTSISIPQSSGSVNKSFYWSVALTNSTSTIYYNTSVHNQTVTNISLSICGAAPYDVVYENFTFKDEATGDSLNASTDLATWGYAVGTSTTYKSYIFTNSTLNPSYAYCFYPSDQSMSHTVTYQYSSTGYPQRHYYQSGTLTNLTSNKVLYLLASGSGIYSSFQIINQAGAPISGAVVQASRQIGGVSTLVEQGTTDSSGLVTFWLNPNYDHSLTVTKTGYATQTLTIRPTQSIYTIVMGGGAVSNGTYSEPIQGIKYTKTPASGILVPGSYDFTFNITASKANMISCKLELVNSSGSIVDSGITACIDHGYISVVHAFVEGDNIYGRYYVDIGSGYIKLEGDANWKFIPTGNQSHYSIKDLLKYLSEPDVLTTSETERRQFEFTKLIAFFVLFAIVAGYMNNKSGFDSANPGIFLFLMPLVIALMSLSGGLTGNGFFYIEGATGFHFLDNYLLAFLTFLVAAGMYLATIRREG